MVGFWDIVNWFFRCRFSSFNCVFLTLSSRIDSSYSCAVIFILFKSEALSMAVDPESENALEIADTSGVLVRKSFWFILSRNEWSEFVPVKEETVLIRSFLYLR